jgi:hypothetical protein
LGGNFNGGMGGTRMGLFWEIENNIGIRGKWINNMGKKLYHFFRIKIIVTSGFD